MLTFPKQPHQFPPPNSSQPPSYLHLHHAISQFIDRINQKIISRIHLVKEVYLDQHKQQMLILNKQLNRIRNLLDEQKLRQQNNDRLHYLEEQRNFFRSSMIKISQQFKQSQDQTIKLRKMLHQKTSQCQLYRSLAKDLETKVIKLKQQKIQNKRYREKQRKETQSTLLVTSAKKRLEVEQPGDKIRERSLRSKNQRQTMGTENYSISARQNMNYSYSLQKLKNTNSVEGIAKSTEPIRFQEINPQNREEILQSYILSQYQQKANKLHFDEEKKIHFDKFTKSDKKELVHRLMSNPSILEDFHSFIFNKNSKMDKVDKKYEDYSSRNDQKISLAKGVEYRCSHKLSKNLRNLGEKKGLEIR